MIKSSILTSCFALTLLSCAKSDFQVNERLLTIQECQSVNGEVVNGGCLVSVDSEATSCKKVFADLDFGNIRDKPNCLTGSNGNGLSCTCSAGASSVSLACMTSETTCMTGTGIESGTAIDCPYKPVASCSEQGAVAKCTLSKGLDGENTHFYYGTLEQGEQECKSSSGDIYTSEFAAL